MRGTIPFEEGQAVESLYLLVDGSVALSYAGGESQHHQLLVEEVHAGEVFGISALIEPYHATATAASQAPAASSSSKRGH